jgi:hypothetical protein
VASPPMKIRRRSRRGAVTYPAQRWTRATCRDRPRRHLPAPPKCRHRGSRRRPRVTRMWARAHDMLLALPERTSGRSALAWRPAGRAPPRSRESRPAKLTPLVVRGATGSRPPTFRRFRPPRLGLLAEVSVAGKVNGLDVDAERAAGGGFSRRSQGTLLPSSGEPKVSNPWNNVQRKDSI